MTRFDCASFCRTCGHEAETQVDALDVAGAYDLAEGDLLSEECCPAPNIYVQLLEPALSLFD